MPWCSFRCNDASKLWLRHLESDSNLERGRRKDASSEAEALALRPDLSGPQTSQGGIGQLEIGTRSFWWRSQMLMHAYIAGHTHTYIDK